MKVTRTALAGVIVIEPVVHGDARGFFLETYSARRYADAGLPPHFVQDNHSRSVAGTLRGLHYQRGHPQGKLVRCVRGVVYDVAVDIRRGSPTFGRWVGVELSEENKRQLYVPPDFAHGFCLPAQESEIEYKCSEYYSPGDERGILWNDPTLAITWPVADPLVSPKDAALPSLEAAFEDLPVYRS